jgi:hypothetical protein
MPEHEPLQPDDPARADDRARHIAEEVAEVVAERIAEDLAEVADLAANGIEIEGEVQVTESTWVVYGNDGYGGEVVVGEYHNAVEATAVLRAEPDAEAEAGGEEPVP